MVVESLRWRRTEEGRRKEKRARKLECNDSMILSDAVNRRRLFELHRRCPILSLESRSSTPRRMSPLLGSSPISLRQLLHALRLLCSFSFICRIFVRMGEKPHVAATRDNTDLWQPGRELTAAIRGKVVLSSSICRRDIVVSSFPSTSCRLSPHPFSSMLSPSPSLSHN
ncbi:hypothetical protein PIB30_020604 [Stylosanthes scabra]|uniref:Uncharacterized protein n=1 Tax=Stylosanthes scabra TaxID=79078 RepID=A0ABU6R8V8_9FABA|nr:hypothetical protein [Stylosanthes scabra]